MGKQVIIRDANNTLRVMDADRIMEYIQGNGINVLGLSIEALQELKKWFYKFGGIPSKMTAIDVDSVFTEVHAKWLKAPIFDKEHIDG